MAEGVQSGTQLSLARSLSLRMASWHQAPRPPPQTRLFYKRQAAREQEAKLRDEGLVALHERTRKQRRERLLAPKRPGSAPVGAKSRLEQEVGAAEGAYTTATVSPARRQRKQLVARQHLKRRGVAEVAKSGGETFRLTAEERIQRQSDKISNVINQLIRGRRQLYGTMMRDAESAFKAIDRDGSGALDYNEFSLAMNRLGLGLREDQCMELALVMDADGDGEIDCVEFVSALQAAEKRTADAKREQVQHDLENPTEPEPAPESEPAPEVRVIEETPTEPVLTKMTPKQRTDLLFQAVLSQDEAVIFKLLDVGVSMDVTRTDRLTLQEETPMEVAVAEGKTRSAAVLAAYTVVTQQRLICLGLTAKRTALETFTSKVQRDDEFKKRSAVALRPWRNARAVESCSNQLAGLELSQKAQVARVLTRRAKHYIDVHAFSNAIADYTAVLALCPIDADAEYDDLAISTHVRRGMVRHFSKQDELAIVDLENGWKLFRAKRESRRLMGESVLPSPLLDKAAHLIHAIRFRLRMEKIDRRKHRPPGSLPNSDKTMPVSDAESAQHQHKNKNMWISAVKEVRDAPHRGVDLIWLIEWAIRNEIPGYADAFTKSEKGKRAIAAVQTAQNCQPHSALKAVLSVVESKVRGPLQLGIEGRVVKANRFNRVLVECTGNREFWYACADLERLPLSHDDIKKRFEAIDEDGSGVLDRDEVAQVAASLGTELNEKQLNEAMEAMDGDCSGEVSLVEFIAWFEREQQDHGKGTVKKAAYLMFGRQDRVLLKPEAAERLIEQCKLPSVHERACAWIEDHKDDDDFDEPISQSQPTTMQMINKIIKPATQRSKQSYADEYLERPVLHRATHYVVHDPENGFWDTVHALLLHQLGLDRSVELRELTADQALNALQMHRIKQGSLFAYAIDWLIFPVHAITEVSHEEHMLLRKTTQKTAIADAGCMVLIMESAVKTPTILNSPELLKTICTGIDAGAEISLTLSFSALDVLSQLLWEQLAETKRNKNALSVVYGGATAGEDQVDFEVVEQQLTHSLSEQKAAEDELSENNHVGGLQMHERRQESLTAISWRSRRRPVIAPAVGRKEKELLAIQAERSEMRVRCHNTVCPWNCKCR